jgi:hypothetical protein
MYLCVMWKTFYCLAALCLWGVCSGLVRLWVVRVNAAGSWPLGREAKIARGRKSKEKGAGCEAVMSWVGCVCVCIFGTCVNATSKKRKTRRM